MKTDLSNWQDLRMDFFLEEILERFWNHAEGTVDKVIEVQYYPALLYGKTDVRAFIGAGITLDFPYSTIKNTVKSNLIKDGNLKALEEYEKSHALGFVMTGSEENKIDAVTLTYSLDLPYRLFLENFGVESEGIEKPVPIILWYNPGKNGKPDFSSAKPKRNRRIRIRFLSLPYFMRVMKELEKNDYKFPLEFVKDDVRLL